jgi:hypothetical protein
MGVGREVLEQQNRGNEVEETYLAMEWATPLASLLSSHPNEIARQK